ncbi:hypothetical protein [Nocardia sp. NPDC049707]|uniref:hypothetical protein n=1 Tax=Nocardia sp. NPDC049707 TaxID=3154735 RepID=UPI003416BC4E
MVSDNGFRDQTASGWCAEFRADLHTFVVAALSDFEAFLEPPVTYELRALVFTFRAPVRVAALATRPAALADLGSFTPATLANRPRLSRL